MTEETNQLTDMHSECGSSEPYALQVTDNSMEPEFPKDCIVIVDPSGSCNDGQYIFVEYDGVRWFRRFKLIDGDKYLLAINKEYPEIKLDNSYDVIGIIVQKNVKREITHYN
jgi:SOS-response transcriptional repressor LexA